jgi:hypothetical protein
VESTVPRGFLHTTVVSEPENGQVEAGVNSKENREIERGLLSVKKAFI